MLDVPSRPIVRLGCQPVSGDRGRRHRASEWIAGPLPRRWWSAGFLTILWGAVAVGLLVTSLARVLAARAAHRRRIPGLLWDRGRH